MKRLFKAVVLSLVVCTQLVYAQKTVIPGLFQYKLDNGLELFVLENNQVPLTKIQITFRCGALTQEPETAGYFHLYEHMLFKGNARYKTEKEFSAAMTALGVAEWNGGTSSEYVTYYFTVPSDKTREGLEFWSHAVKSPVFDERELEIEKNVVINEINGYNTQPDWVYRAALDRMLFPKFPWRRDVGGYEDILRKATVQSMKDIQSGYYIPNNAAIFVGGDVVAGEVLAMVKALYGDWAAGKDPWSRPREAQPTPAAQQPAYLVYPDESLPPGIGYMQLSMRGPDVTSDPAATFAADVWGQLVANPAGRFKNSVMGQVPGLYHKNYLGAGYYTQRDGGQISFSSYFYTSASRAPMAQRAIEFFKPVLVDSEIAAMVADPAYFDDAEFEIVKQILEDQLILMLETPESFIQTLSFWWAVASSDYFFSYVPAMHKVSRSDMAAFLQTYIMDNVEVVAIRANPLDVEAERADLEQSGFTVIDNSNAFWWRNR